MASADIAYQQTVGRIRATVTSALLRDFVGAGSWDKADMQAFLTRAVPISRGGQLATGQATNAYMRSLVGQTVPLDTSAINAGLRGVPPAEVYARPYKEVWQKLGAGASLPDAVSAGTNRLANITKTDMQLAKVHSAQDYISNADGIYGYKRQAHGESCSYCLLASTQAYHSDALLPLHGGCSCNVIPITDPGEFSTFTNSDTLANTAPIASPHSELGATFPNETAFPTANVDELGQWANSDSIAAIKGADGPTLAMSNTSLDPGVRAVADYIDEGYDAMNETLRGLPGSWSDPYFDRRIADLTRYIDTATTTTHDMTVWRGMATSMNPEVGSLVTDGAFMSTSVSQEIALEFSSAQKGCLWKILVPKGTKAINVSTQEAELLIQRGSSLRVLSTGKFGDRPLITAIVEQG